MHARARTHTHTHTGATNLAAVPATALALQWQLTGWATLQHLRWDTSDGHLHLKHSAAFPRPRSVYSARKVNQQIAAGVAAADRGEYKSARIQVCR